jgi:hypothetical protein
MYAIFNVVTTRADADSALVVDDREDWLSDIGGRMARPALPVAWFVVKLIESSRNIAKVTEYCATDYPRSSCHRRPDTADWAAL